ncbi:24913_t:CDS:2 [Gigaspora margarita]|uniref:24913_t:CDS:1 n=1 Tax=Gigaspora margarita TaxID=4874 RepID=A0ABN7V6D1_GIGMA|nr:24913_t:CDS:2 [Gigaspora margarita]
MRLGEKSCRSFMKEICNAAGIDIKDRDIVNHLGRSTPITSLFQKDVAMGPLLDIKQKEDALSLLINSVGTLLSGLQEQEDFTKNDEITDSNHCKAFSADNSNLTKQFPPSEDNSCGSASEDKFYANTSGTIIKNYYITAEHVNIN